MMSSSEIEFFLQDDVRDRIQQIARAEITRQRKRLNAFSPDQISAVEAVLISTVNEISGQVTQRIRKYSEEEQIRFVSVWSAQAA
jgi:glutamyl-tRNA reductase